MDNKKFLLRRNILPHEPLNEDFISCSRDAEEVRNNCFPDADPLASPGPKLPLAEALIFE